MTEVEHTRTSAPVPPVDSEPADAEPSGMAMLDTTGNMFQGNLDQPAPLRCSTCTTQNQLPWRYQNICIAGRYQPHPASGMHGLVCVFVFILYHVCTPFLWEV